MSAARQDEYKARARALARQVYLGIIDLHAMQSEWNHAAYGDQGGGVFGLQTAEGEPTAAQFGAAIFDSADAIVALLGSGHGTNLSALL